MRLGVAAAVVWLSIIGCAGANGAHASVRKLTNIPAEDLASALQMLAKDRDLQVVYVSEEVIGIQTQGAVGQFTSEEALKQLLKGTGLSYRYLDDRTITVVRASRSFSTSTAIAGSATAAPTPPADGGNRVFLLAQANPAQGASGAPADKSPVQASISGPAPLQEVLVTARKRTENLEDVPMAINVVDATTMAQQQTVLLQDYYASVPGLSINDYGTGRISINMRGVSTGDNGNPTVGITIDDVPFGASDTAVIVGPQFTPQLDPSDLERVEFLMGPQGTLYGASSLSGVMRYVTAVPDLTSFSGHVEVDGNSIDSGGLGYGVRGSINVPVIADTLALRLSAFDRHDAGYIDDPSHGLTNVNSTDVSGGHLAVFWQPAENFSVRLSALVQRALGNGDGTIDTNSLYQSIAGGLTQNRLPGTGGTDYQIQLYSAALNFHTDLFDITSITGYGLNRASENLDFTGYYGLFSQEFFNVQGATGIYGFKSTKLTEELRVASRTNSRLEWQVGGFYTNEVNGPNTSPAYANDLATGAVVGQLYALSYPAWYGEYAAFGNLTYHFTDRFSLQVGARQAHDWQSYLLDFSGLLVGPVPEALSETSSDNAFTYLVSPQLRLSDSLMSYARVASGYQAGGPNTVTPGVVLPPSFGPSTTVNYELGVKSNFLDRHLLINADIFYIAWSKIQLTGYTADGISYVFNGGTAKSQGVEISTEARPLEGLTLSATASYIDAMLTSNPGKGFPGMSGDPLPLSGKYNASLSVEDRFPVSHSVSGFVGATGAYVGTRYEAFPAAVGQPQPSIPSYAYLNLRAGIDTHGYRVTALVKNVTNERGILNSTEFTGYANGSTDWHTHIITPRTISVSISKAF